MKFNKKLCLLATVCFALVILGETSLAQQKADVQSGLKKAIDVYISAQAKENEADEYPEARRVVEGDIDGDGDKDAAVLYSLEGMGGGGNNWAQTVTVFINTNGAYKAVTNIVVGGKLFRSFELESVSKGKIVGISETCTDTPQGLCDDPKKETVNLVFANNKLKEHKTEGKEF